MKDFSEVFKHGTYRSRKGRRMYIGLGGKARRKETTRKTKT
jgi:hypothetical protein